METMLNEMTMVVYFYVVTIEKSRDTIKLETIIAQSEEDHDEHSDKFAVKLYGRLATHSELIKLYNIISVSLGSQKVLK